MGWSRGWVTVLVGVLTVALVPVTPAVSQVEEAAVPVVAMETSEAEDQPPVEPEWARAAALGHRVEVMSRRTADSRTFVNPDGMLTMELFSGPAHVWEPNGADPDGEGRWLRVDTTLVATPDGVVPRRSPAGVAFSPGGSGEFASLTAEEVTLGIGWSGSLPVPELDGPVAVYRNVWKDVDLELEALSTGFKWRLVLHARPTKRLSFDLPLYRVGLTVSQTSAGQLQLADVTGRTIAVSDPAVMWGADIDDLSGDPSRIAPVTTALVNTSKGQVLRVTPDQAFLADPTVALPITIDPSPTLTATADTFTQSNIANTSQWSNTELKAGTYDSGTTRARTYVRFDTSSLANTNILAADLRLWNFHSSSCTGRAVTVRRLTAAFNSSTVWSNQPTSTTSGEGSATFAHGWSSSCPAAWGSIPTRTIVQTWANGTANYGFLVMASETDTLAWKKFNSTEAASNKPRLAVTYNSYPNTPSSLSPAANALTTSLKPTLSATFSDPDGGSGTLFFEIRTTGGTLVASGSTTGVTSGSSGAWAPGSNLTSQTTYQWRVRAYDGTDYSAWTAYRDIRPDNTAPAAPSTSSSTHSSESTWYSSRNPSVSWSASDWSGIGGYSWVLDQTSGTIPNTTSNGTVTSTSYSGLADGIWYFHIRARDGAGNWGATRHRTIRVDGTAPVAPTVSSSTHSSQTTWYASKSPTLEWSTSDLSGIGGYSWVLDQVSGTTPNTTSNGTVTSTSYSNLADGVWYFHIRARDGAGNWGATRHRTIRIDSTAPAKPTVSSSSHPDQNVWHTPEDGPSFNDPTFSWTPVTDLSGITGYSYSLDQNPTGVPNNTVDTTGTSVSFTDIGAGGSGVFWFHVKARNGAGLWSAVTHYKVQIDAGTATMVEPGDQTTLQGQVTLRATTGPNATGLRFDWWNGEIWQQLGLASEGPDDVWSHTWNTAAMSGGQRVFPNGPYQLRATPLFTGGAGNPVVGPVVTVDDTRLGANPWWHFQDLGAGAQVNLATGNLLVTDTDTDLGSVSGSIAFVRSYNSQGAARDGLLGWGWEFAFPSQDAPAAFVSLTRWTDDGDWVEVLDVTGEAVYFLRDEGGGWLPEAGAEGITLELTGGVWVVTDLDGTTYRFADAGPDLPGMLIEARPPVGAGVTYGYDATGRLVTVTDPTGLKTFRLEYAAGRLARIRAEFDSNQVVAEYGYDAGGHLTSVTDPRTGLTTAYGYAGHLLTSITPPGQTPVTLGYLGSPIGRLATASRAVPGGGTATTSLSYGSWDEGGQTTLTTPRGAVWTYRFDLSSRPREVTPPIGPTTETRWNANNQTVYTQTAAESAAGLATISEYSSEELACNLSGVTGANDGTDLCQVTRPELGTVRYEYDEGLGEARRLVTRHIHADGTFVRYEYDPDGLAAGKPNRERTYSDTGVLVQTRAHTYDAWGRPVTETAPGGQVTTFTYHPTADAVQGGLLATMTRPGVPTRTYTHNLWGQPLSEGWPAGATVIAYDPAGREVSRTAPGEPTVTTTYDPTTGLVTAVTDTSGTISYSHDSWGRVVAYTDATGATTTTSYDLESNVVQTATPVGTTGYQHDLAGRVVVIVDPTGITSVSYRADGTYDTVVLPNGVTAAYTSRDGVGDLATLSYDGPEGLLGSFARDYDITGRVARDTFPEGTRDYTYDTLGRLVTVTDADPDGMPVEVRAYTFDTNGNRTQLTVTPEGGIPEVIGYSHDTADRLTTVTGGPDPGTFSYDINGNTVTSPGRTLAWTGANRLKSVTQSGLTVTWGLDAAGRTLTRSDGTDTSTYHYTGDGDSPAWTVDGGIITRYVPGPAGLSAAHQPAGGDATWLLTTPHGGIWAHTDQTGQTTATFLHDEYGVPLTPSASGLAEGRYGWLGRQQRETDPTTGLILMGVRPYDPTLGRFLSIDPIHGGNATDYDYCHADPINCYDLDGRYAQSCRSQRLYKWCLRIVTIPVKIVRWWAAKTTGTLRGAPNHPSRFCYAGSGGHESPFGTNINFNRDSCGNR